LLPLVPEIPFMSKTNLLNILRTNKTVFTFKDLMLFSGETNLQLLKRQVSYYTKTKSFYHIRRGIYAKDKNYNRFELATKIYTPSYISFETVLTTAGIIFQYYQQIFIASYLSRKIVCDEQAYSYKKIKPTVLIDNAGIENKENYAIARAERAFLDTVYLYKEYHFDDLSSLNWDNVFAILPIYNNKSMTRKINKYYEFRSSQT